MVAKRKPVASKETARLLEHRPWASIIIVEILNIMHSTTFGK